MLSLQRPGRLHGELDTRIRSPGSGRLESLSRRRDVTQTTQVEPRQTTDLLQVSPDDCLGCHGAIASNDRAHTLPFGKKRRGLELYLCHHRQVPRESDYHAQDRTWQLQLLSAD